MNVEAKGKSTYHHDTASNPINKKNQQPAEPTAFSEVSVELRKEQMAVESALAAKNLLVSTIKSIIGPKPFFIEAAKVQEIVKKTGLTEIKLLQELVLLAKPLARSPISNYKVSEAGLGISGNIYLGVNLEFPGCPLNQAIHGEQTLITLARNHGEKKLLYMALPAEPCGFCRQFINEIGEDADDLKILIPGIHEPKTFPELLPNAFGPRNLDSKGGLLTLCEEFHSKHENPLIARAVEAAHNAYAPYTSAHSGVAIKTKDGKIYGGSYLENAAYNPSLSPLQAALVALVADGQQYEDIIEVILVEKKAKISQEDTTMMVLKKISPEASFQTIHLENF